MKSSRLGNSLHI